MAQGQAILREADAPLPAAPCATGIVAGSNNVGVHMPKLHTMFSRSKAGMVSLRRRREGNAAPCPQAQPFCAATDNDCGNRDQARQADCTP